MAPRVDPILLWGFCFATQQKLQFNQSWACAFHCSWYTDERHSMWDAIEDSQKRREIRYGNNIYVLFRALLYCRDFYGQDSLWAAIAKGFNTNATVVRTTVDILTEARRAQRNKPSKDVSETARAVDDWIDFLDGLESHPSVLSDLTVFKAAEAFFKTQEKKVVNAARVPTNPHQTLHVNTSRFLPRGAASEENRSPRWPPSPSIKLESSGSAADSHSTLQLETDPRGKANATNHPGSRLQEALDGGVAIPNTNSPGRQLNPPGLHHSLCLSPRLKRIASLEKQLAETKSKLSVAPRPDSAATASNGPAAAFPGELGEVIGGLKKDMATVTNVISTMMESMHDIVDSLNSLQDEVSGLATQQKELVAAAPSAGSNNQQQQAASPNLDTVLQPLQALAGTVNLLRDDVSALKNQVQATTSATPSAPPPEDSTVLKTLLQEQTSRIDTLVSQMSALQSQITRQQEQQQQQRQQQQQTTTPTGPPQQQQPQPQPQPQPQTLRQAMAAAERDLKAHLAAVQRFYHQLASGRGGAGASRAATERTAEFLALLTEGVRVAGAGAGMQGS
ncbi:8dea7b2b-5de9-436f-b87e-148033f3ac2f [Thermothielavioides terrestris]|uniref:8dea7b2b-5de9-436f-b87e-148033f3ac2f n=1 Tax=Thermothielavioides terrestris TaxID=2587410 RepID=A0A446BPY9_9PEZI|nr:8dea7b2b-5de9-436f-b87e-148033f3ac2f [Thermothielavioides terrestris]